jgi:hypothetical protein
VKAKRSATNQAPTPALVTLCLLAGSWECEIRWSDETHKLVGGPALVRGAARFEWIEDGHFLVMRFGGDGAPAARWLIGRDETSGLYGVLYSDARGVSRLYQMSLTGRVWRMWRDAPHFRQRFEGRISRDGRSIKARWEKSVDGSTWQHDFDIRYAKTRGPRPTPSRRRRASRKSGSPFT